MTKSAAKQANIDLFHKAIVSYNLGDHKTAITAFREAIEYNPLDVQSMVYLPECYFLSRSYEFPDVIAVFEETERKIQTLPNDSTWRVPKNVHRSLLSVKLGNCYYPGCRHEPYRKYANLRLAEAAYKQALTLDENSYLAKFSYAQALILKSRRELPEVERVEARELGQRLFTDVFNALKVRVGEVTESKMQVTHYYTLAICCKEGRIQGTDPKQYVLRIYERGGQLPPHDTYRVFSPLSKNDLPYRELKHEVSEFEQQLTSSTDSRRKQTQLEPSTLS